MTDTERLLERIALALEAQALLALDKKQHVAGDNAHQRATKLLVRVGAARAHQEEQRDRVMLGFGLEPVPDIAEEAV